MSNTTQSFLAEAVSVLIECAGDRAIFQETAIQYLKDSFRNGLKTGYRKAYSEMKTKKKERQK